MTLTERLDRWLFDSLPAQGSGPAVAALFQRLLALVFIDAWVSLLSQVDVLIGSHGLTPWTHLAASVREAAVSWWDFPTVLRAFESDGAMRALAGAGLVLAIAALFGRMPRVLLALTGALYVSFDFAGGGFFRFQWDNLLIECAFLAIFLPADRPARWAHALFRVLLFKLYWESGLAKYESALRDWHDGSAMTFYYETAPLPTWPAWFAHHLPLAWHHLESWGALGLELIVPLFIFGPRKLRLVALAALTGFQVLNLATANYGFFVYLALALHVFLLDDADLPLGLRRVLRRSEPVTLTSAAGWPRRTIAGGIAATYVTLSVLEGLQSFAPPLLPDWGERVLEAKGPIPLINAYHLFGSITRERLEPTFETQAADGTWTEQDLWHKPGDPHRHPDFVAPHQPRVDFLLWFYGLSARRRPPDYVAALLHRLCEEPAAVQTLFRAPLPEHPRAARITFERYHFSSWSELIHDGVWWAREPAGTGPALTCR